VKKEIIFWDVCNTSLRAKLSACWLCRDDLRSSQK